MALDVPPLYIVTLALSFVEAAFFLAAAKGLSLLAEKYVGGKDAARASVGFMLAGMLYFLYKLVYFLMNYLNLPIRGYYGQLLAHAILFAAGLVFLSAANKLATGMVSRSAS
ncbi:MAG TPA: hypothetical protein VJH23_03460 [archaeon]|nr:hypothetical protein [archaeon]